MTLPTTYRNIPPAPMKKGFGGWRKSLETFVAWANEGIQPEFTEPSDKGSAKRTPRNINWRLRALVLMRDGARCQLCGATPQSGARLHVDHIKPWSKGGETVIENLQILCEPCNIGKSDIEVDGTASTHTGLSAGAPKPSG